MLGNDLCSALKEAGANWIGVDLPEVDISDPSSIANVVKVEEPELIINTAAMTDVDGCESDHEKAYRANALGALNVARAASISKAFVVHLSTDYVFDGTKTSPYREDDPVNPLGIYGKTKAEGEKMLLSEAPDNSLIIRTQWLYGLHGKNFVESILNACKERDVLKVVDDQHGRPTFTEDLVKAILKLAKLRPTGVYHVANSGETTWHGFASAIVEIEGLCHIKVETLSTAELNRPAPRPLNSVLDLEKFQALTKSALPDWKDALTAYLKTRKLLKG
jgi:dTDP-4-dehydrorhamnose reductase